MVALAARVGCASLCYRQHRKLSADLEGREPEALVKALHDTDMFSGSAISPEASYNPKTGAVRLSNISESSVIWGTNLIWGSSVTWGTGARAA